MAKIIRRTGANLQIAIAGWLLRANVRIRSGRHAGAIAGWLDAHGEPEFAYPEITGYYLSWLSKLAVSTPEEDVTLAATMAVEWLRSVTTEERPPQTRYYVDNLKDWRNDATFTFDLAMICRGLHDVRHLVPPEPREEVLRNLLRFALPNNEALPVAIHVRKQLPDRWSTRPGPFQLKTAAALLSVQEHPACWKTFERWNGRVVSGLDTNDLHAAFYALEGLIQFGRLGRREAFEEAANCLEILFPYIDNSRSDVVAQALGVIAALREHGFLDDSPWTSRQEGLLCRLEEFICEDGALTFRPVDKTPRHFNTWSAIFAWQYLDTVTSTTETQRTQR